ncbi:autotransporter assembly complex protein TamA [Sedimentitalea nanhaiensis]|uniref:Autotransporter secretion outer membrane protein TamA n=1 Tax=Sedimentitalea nanhaiensis TaxID=999627 RepID=A0A1I7E7J6_9RHOB|nr:BamA/TamA family outer membrane protein [Sedimentitalea nanhaiensis]SFU19918.1 autotransporter secretion outer membrane protein TamA [Sedimentitalea nanhaiensis]
MMNTGRCLSLTRGLVAGCLALAPGLAFALTTSLNAPGASEQLQDRLRDSSSALAAEESGLDTVQEILAAAMADYRTLVQILYDEGYFSPVVNIRVNGREAATIPPLSPPRSVDSIAITVTTGKPFRFGTARIAPLAVGTELPDGFRSGAPANTGILRDTTSIAVIAWNNAGHAKAEVGEQRIVANHRQSVLNADIEVLPGPKLKFGRLIVPRNSAVRPEALEKIAAFPSGATYDPAQVQKVGTRLRRTGAFSSVGLQEAETPNPDGTLDFVVTLADQAPRRISFGAEIASTNGVDVTAKWIHRNLFGAAERFQFEAAIRNIGGEEDIDGGISMRLDQPAALGGDDNLFYLALLDRDNNTHYSLTRFALGVGVRRVFSDHFFSELSISGAFHRSDDAFGDNRDFRMIPIRLRSQWDKRDNSVNATRGYFLDTLVTPYIGFSGTKSGLALYGDARGYLSLTPTAAIVLAGRAQIGSILGPSLSEISPEYLFFSGGTDTVRGQPYQSLGVPVNGGIAGGRSFLGLQTEVRGRVTEKISLVGFFDIAAVDRKQWISSSSEYQSGAGLGIRYDLGALGPLRLDLAMPVDGTTGDGLQFYIGIGQAF